MTRKKVYICHSSKYDYVNKIYNPIKSSKFMETYDFVFPHDGDVVNTKDIISNADLVIVDISGATFGQGIEIGWADAAGVDILCIYKKGMEKRRSIQLLTDKFIEYNDSHDLISKLEEYL